MIFVTVGSQMPFERLIKAVDQWASQHPEQEVQAQIGNASFAPANMRFQSTLSPDEFQRAVKNCKLIVGHAGMGTVITALEHMKPMILLPRRGDLQETRNDHQIATLNWLRSKVGVHAAFNEGALVALLDQWVQAGLEAPANSEAPGSRKLVGALRSFVQKA